MWTFLPHGPAAITDEGMRDWRAMSATVQAMQPVVASVGVHLQGAPEVAHVWRLPSSLAVSPGDPMCSVNMRLRDGTQLTAYGTLADIRALGQALLDGAARLEPEPAAPATEAQALCEQAATDETPCACETTDWTCQCPHVAPPVPAEATAHA